MQKPVVKAWRNLGTTLEQPRIKIMFENSSEPTFFLTWNDVINPLFLIVNILPSVLNGILLATIIIDPLKCFRSCYSYLLFNFGLLGLLPPLTVIVHILTLYGYGYQTLWLYGFVLGFYNTIFAVFMLTLDRYVLVCKPLLYSRTVTKCRVLYGAIASWISSVALAASCFPAVYDVVGIKLATKVFLFTLLPVYLFLVIASIILNMQTWKTVATRRGRLARLLNGSERRKGSQNDTRLSSSVNRVEIKRLENERRFLKVVLLLVVNLMIFILPQVILVCLMSLNVCCELGFTEIEHPNVSLFQTYLFPLFYITTPLLYMVFIPKYRKSCLRLFVSGNN